MSENDDAVTIRDVEVAMCEAYLRGMEDGRACAVEDVAWLLVQAARATQKPYEKSLHLGLKRMVEKFRSTN